MSYYATFTFNYLKIPAEKVAEAELVLHHALSCTHESPEKCPGDCFDHKKVEGTFCDRFMEDWEDVTAEEDIPVPLVALASGSARGAITIYGSIYKKWGNWEEPLFDALAPFIQNGGVVTVMGEDYGTPTEWIFDGGVRFNYEYKPVRVDELRKLQAKAIELEVVKIRLTLATELLQERVRLADVCGNGAEEGRLLTRMDEFLREKPPLEQLAETAE